jgi:nucleoside-diphosphate kinase
MSEASREQTFVMIKPESVRMGLIGEIIRRFEQRGMQVVALEMFQPTTDEMENHYPKDEAWVTRLGEKTLSSYQEFGFDVESDFGTNDPAKIGPQIRTWLIEHMTSAPLVKMIIQGRHAISMTRKIVGETMPFRADMGTIRGDFSNDSPAIANHEQRVLYNIIHASEDAEEAAHEIEHWFGGSSAGFVYDRFGF